MSLSFVGRRVAKLVARQYLLLNKYHLDSNPDIYQKYTRAA